MIKNKKKKKIMHHSKLTYKKVDRAIEAVCQVYGVQRNHVLNVRCRPRPIPDARRMLVHYMHNHLYIKHYHMKDFIDNLCHSTSIYHCRKLDFFLQREKDTKRKYLKFREEAGEFNDKLEQLEIKKQEIVEMQKEVKELLKKIKKDDKRI
tara:strand:+ start:1090 stop:1539 length:450 start_codon:yes stop_codon:yes gene_type:complete